MRIQEIYNLAIQKGIEADFRGREAVENFLGRKRDKFEKLSEEEKKEFDKEALENPYLDSRILNIADSPAGEREIKRVLAGIDIEPAEILLAKELGDIDLIISHHPLGKGLAHLSDVMQLQCDVLEEYGVPINIAEGLMKERISEVARGINAVNHQRTVHAAKMLKFNLMCLHTVADNLAAKFLKVQIEKECANRRIERLEDLLGFLKKIPEYNEAMKIGAGPKIFVGEPERRCGKIALTEITGGTEGNPKLYEKMAAAGIGTIIGMHISEEHKKEAEASNLNVVIAGHISSDSLGMNLFLDELEKRGVEIIPCSGLIRVPRLSTINKISNTDAEIKERELHRITSTAIIYKDGKYLLVRRSFGKKAFPGKWTVPGGGLEIDDYINTPKTTNDHWYCAIEKSLRREIKEECNLEVGKVKYLLDIAFVRPDGLPAIILSFYCPYLSGEVKLDEDNIDYAWVDYQEAKKYDLIEGLLEEIALVERILKGDDENQVEYLR